MLLLLHDMHLGTLAPVPPIGETSKIFSGDLSEATTMETSEANLKESTESTPATTPEAFLGESYEAPPVGVPEAGIPDPPAAPEGFVLEAIPDPNDLDQGKPRCITLLPLSPFL